MGLTSTVRILHDWFVYIVEEKRYGVSSSFLKRFYLDSLSLAPSAVFARSSTRVASRARSQEHQQGTSPRTSLSSSSSSLTSSSSTSSSSPSSPTQMANTIYWFRKALRLHDNPSLVQAIAGSGQVNPVFVLDPWFVRSGRVGTNRMQFLLQALEDVDESLRKMDSRLILLQGNPVEELPRVMKEWGVTRLAFELDTEPYALKRDEEVKEAARRMGVEVVTCVGHTLVDPAAVMERAGGKPVTVYGTFCNHLKEVMKKAPVKTVAEVKEMSGLCDGAKKEVEERGCKVPTLAEIGYDAGQAKTPFKGGEKEALKRMEKYLSRTKVVPKLVFAPFDPPSLFRCLLAPLTCPLLPPSSRNPPFLYSACFALSDLLPVHHCPLSLPQVRLPVRTALLPPPPRRLPQGKQTAHEKEEIDTKGQRRANEGGGEGRREKKERRGEGRGGEERSAKQSRGDKKGPEKRRGEERRGEERRGEERRGGGITEDQAGKHTQPPVSLEGQLLWREFYYVCSVATPNYERMEGNPICRQIPWGSDQKHEEFFLAWKVRGYCCCPNSSSSLPFSLSSIFRIRCFLLISRSEQEARTGYPWIDAAMTQLRDEGHIHHLARHAVGAGKDTRGQKGRTKEGKEREQEEGKERDKEREEGRGRKEIKREGEERQGAGGRRVK
eukprot:736248-Hanusia_phi.AAC.2